MQVLGYVAAGLAGWIVLASLGGFALGFAASRLKRLLAHEPQPSPDPWLPPDRDYDTVEFPSIPVPALPPVPQSTRRTESPLYLTGYALDAEFYGVLAPSFGEYK